MEKIVQLQHKGLPVNTVSVTLAIIHKDELLYDVLEDIKDSELKESDFKTINGESIIGEGDIEIAPELQAGNAISIEDNTISVTSHIYNPELNSVAFGNETDAVGQHSHSEGYFTSAEGEASHAEGDNTTALGQSAHAEGTGGSVTLLRVMSGDSPNRLQYINAVVDDSASDSAYNFLAGSDFTSDSDYSFLPNSSDLVTGAKYFVEKGNKLAGWIGRTLYYADGSVIGKIVRFPDKSQGESDGWFEIDREATISSNTWVSAYIKTGAAGESSHSEGYLSDVSGKYGHAEGERTQSTGTAAHSEGIRTKAFGAYSHAEGHQTQALAFGTHTEGMYTHAEGEYAHAEGYDTKASGLYSHGEGFRSLADAAYSHAEGHDTTAAGIGSHSEGHVSVAHGEYSHAEGYNVNAEADYSHSEGKDTYAQGEGSHVEGENTLTNGKFAHAEGYETQAHADYTHTEGWKSIAEVRDDWVKIGTVTVKSVTDNYAQSLPAFNFDSDNQGAIKSAFDEALPNIVKFKNKSESEYFSLKNYIVDDNAIVDGDFAVSAYGTSEYKAGTRGWNSDYIGHTFDVYRKYVSGIAAHAEGFETLTEGSYSHAEGKKTQTKNEAEHAQGFRNKSHQNSSTLGDPGNTIFSVGIGQNDNIKPIIIPESLGQCYSEGELGYDLSGEDLSYLDRSDEGITEFSYYITTKTLENPEIFVGSRIYLGDDLYLGIGLVISACRIDVPAGQDPEEKHYRIYFRTTDESSGPSFPTLALRTHVHPPVKKSKEDKRNALEIMQNGDIYVKGVGSYNGDNIDQAYTLQQILKSLKSGGDIDLSQLDETFEVIAAALNDLNRRLNDVDTVASALLVNHEDRIQTIEE